LKVSFSREAPIVKGIVLQESKSSNFAAWKKSGEYGTFFNLRASSINS
jgi:hypothetical protein